VGVLGGGTGEYVVPDTIDPALTELRDEFMAEPCGYHSAELQLVLGGMRSNRALPRWVLITREPGRSWMLAEVPRRRGAVPRIFTEPVFTDRADAERHVFDLRWQAMSAHGTADE
jgi:hypothetical protein